MKVVGVIAEYNLFHNGHAAQLEMLKRQYGFDRVVVCLSSTLVQRGEPAFLPDGVRAAAALTGPEGQSADLVVALPAPYAAATAQQFAAAGVRLLAGVGCTALAFGAETPDVAAIDRAAALLESEECESLLQQLLAESGGSGYALCRQQALARLAPELAPLLGNANDNLGVEYCAALRRLALPMTPLALPRMGAAHGDAAITGSICSGAALRAAWAREGAAAAQAVTPAHAFALYRQAEQQGLTVDPARWETALLSRLRQRALEGPEGFAGLRGLSEGLENRLYRAVQSATSLQQLYEALQTRRYPRARLRRLCLDAALGYGLAQEPGRLAVPALPPYARLLGARPGGTQVLKNATLPVDASLSRLAALSAECARTAKAECAAADLVALCRRQPGPMGLAFTEKPCFAPQGEQPGEME